MKNLLLLAAVLCFSSAIGQSKIPSAESQIKTALYACPEMYQEGAKILGYNQKGELITLREGTNELICLASDPNRNGVSVSCYSDKLEPYMKRGRELVAEGKNEVEKRDIRKIEDHDFGSGELKSSKIRYVLYKPYMTSLETGLPSKPQAPGMPWLMDANTHRSHIMITPPSEN